MIPKMNQDSLSSSLKTCYKYLNQTSRSFAAVIQALDGEMRHAVCIFYLVLRALDTLEDDMTISIEKKIPCYTTSTCTFMSLTGGSLRAKRRTDKSWRTFQRLPSSLEIWLRNIKW